MCAIAGPRPPALTRARSPDAGPRLPATTAGIRKGPVGCPEDSPAACQHAGMAHEPFHQVQDDLRAPYRALREAIPEVMSAYGALSAAAMADGALTAKTKELIALAVSITRECDGCI